MLTLETQNQTPKTSITPSSGDTSNNDEGFSFAEFLKGASKYAFALTPKDAQQLSLESKDETSDPKEMLLSLLQSDDKAKETNAAQSLLELLKGDNENHNFMLNPALTQELSINDLKYLIHKAKSYLKRKILQADPNLVKEKLPKSLKGLLQLADKLKIEVTEISFETIQKQELSLKTAKTKFQNESNTDEEITEQPHQTKKIIVQKKNSSLKLKEDDDFLDEPIQTKKTKVEEQIEVLDKERIKIKDITKQIENFKSTPLFQTQKQNIDIRHIMTTSQLIEHKSKKEQTRQNEKSDLLHSLLTQREKKSSSSIQEPLFDILKQKGKKEKETLQSADTTSNIQKESSKEGMNEFEKLLRNDTQTHEQKLHLQKSADTLDVKIHEAKQMMKYLSQDIKKAIDEYKPPFSRIKVKLNPQKLGEMDLTVVQRGNNVHINLSSNNAALNVLTNNLHELRTQLNQNGINNASFNFNSDAQNQQQKQKERDQRREYDYFANNEESEEQKSSLEIIVPRYI